MAARYRPKKSARVIAPHHRHGSKQATQNYYCDWNLHSTPVETDKLSWEATEYMYKTLICQKSEAYFLLQTLFSNNYQSFPIIHLVSRFGIFKSINAIYNNNIVEWRKNYCSTTLELPLDHFTYRYVELFFCLNQHFHKGYLNKLFH